MPHELWSQAAKEHPGDDEARRARYMELMIEAGHVIEKGEAATDRSLSSGDLSADATPAPSSDVGPENGS